MKKHRSLQRFLLPLLIAVTLGAGCEGYHPQADQPTIQGSRDLTPLEWNGPPGFSPCDCGSSCKNFDTELTLNSLDTLIHGQPFDFSVKLRQTSRCPAVAALQNAYGNPQCHVNKNLRAVDLDWDALNAATDKLEAFGNIQSITLDGLPNQRLWKDDDSGTLFSEEDAIIFFKWRESSEHPDPTRAMMTPDGICIIGIMTEPHYFPPNNWGGRPNTFLTKLTH